MATPSSTATVDVDGRRVHASVVAARGDVARPRAACEREEKQEEGVHPPRPASAASSTWTADVNGLLSSWGRRVHARHRAHAAETERCNRWKYVLGVPTAIFTSVTSVGGFSTYRNCEPSPSSVACTSAEDTRFALAVCAAGALVTSQLQNVLDYGGRAARHKAAADGYSALHHSIEALLQLPVEARGDALDVLRDVRARYDKANKDAPALGAVRVASLDADDERTPVRVEPGSALNDLLGRLGRAPRRAERQGSARGQADAEGGGEVPLKDVLSCLECLDGARREDDGEP